MKLVLSKLVTAAVVALFSTAAWSGYVSTGTGNLTFIENGWFGEGFAIHMTSTAAVTGCGAPATEFGIAADHPAYKYLVSLMMMAYSQQLPVQLVVDQGVCTLGARTKIVAIRLM